MPCPTACPTVFPLFRKNAFYFVVCLFLNEMFLLIGSQVLQYRNLAYADFTTPEAMTRVAWLSGAGNFVINTICRFIFYSMQHHEESNDVTPEHPEEMTLSNAECLFYTALHTTGFPLFGAGASHFMKFNKPLRAAVVIAAGMVVTFGVMSCLLFAVVAVCFGWEWCGRRETKVLSYPVAQMVNDPYRV